jgi:hypothetical protein
MESEGSYLIHNSPTLQPNVTQMNAAHILELSFIVANFNVILLLTAKLHIKQQIASSQQPVHLKMAVRPKYVVAKRRRHCTQTA